MSREQAEAVRRMAKAVAGQLARRNGGLPASAMDAVVADGMYAGALAYESWKPDGGSSFESWAWPYITRYAQIAVNDAQGRTGRGERRPVASLDAMLADPDDPFDAPDERAPTASQTVDAVAVRAAVRRLPERERVAVVGTYWHGMTATEVGTVLGVGKTMARRILTRAHDQLRKELAA